jgi:drug/metabolite transporter (DMT)-like permease
MPSRDQRAARRSCDQLRGDKSLAARRVTARRATAIGLLAIVLWSAMAGLIRVVAESFGATTGVALIYTVASVGLWATRRPQRLRSFSVSYLVIAGGLFVFYEIAAGLSLALASSTAQTIQVGVVNYFWPTLTVLLLVVVKRGRGVSRLVVPGILVATAGIIWVVGGDAGLSPTSIYDNVASNSVPYALALAGAISWSFYNVFSPRLAAGQDAITIFVTAVAITLWIVCAITGAHWTAATAKPSAFLALLVAGIVIASGYASWNVGLLRGNTTFLASASYATPVLSSAIAAILLGGTLSPSFWEGVALVVCGSLLSLRATRDGGAALKPPRQTDDPQPRIDNHAQLSSRIGSARAASRT